MQPQDTVRIPLYAKDGTVIAYSLIDTIDADFVTRWRWGVHVCRGKPYAGRRESTPDGGRSIRLHRVLLGLEYGDKRHGDHINRDTLDNRRLNLRVVTHGENGHNQSPQRGGTSPYRGVSWAKSAKKWYAHVKVNQKMISLGFFDDELEAAEAARLGRLRYLSAAVD